MGGCCGLRVGGLEGVVGFWGIRWTCLMEVGRVRGGGEELDVLALLG